jgi:transcriptional regulator with XRE-family HTH domain
MDGPVKIGRGGSGQRPQRLLRTMIGEVLRRTRLAQGRTLADVARAARVSMPYLSEVERGRKEASSEVLAAVCAALRLDLSELLAGVGRELAGDRARRATVVRLGTFQSRGAPSQPGGSGDAVCQLAA